MTINPETAVSYAALILALESLTVTPDKLQTLLKAANVEIEPIWSTILAKVLEGKDIKRILTSVENSGPATSGQNGNDEKDDGDGQIRDGASAHSYHGSEDGDSDSDIGLSLFD